MDHTAAIEFEQRMHGMRLIAEPLTKHIYFTTTPSLSDPALRPGLREFWAKHQRFPFLGPFMIACTFVVVGYAIYKQGLKLSPSLGHYVVGFWLLVSGWMTFREVTTYQSIQRYVEFPDTVPGETVVETPLEIEQRSIQRSGDGSGSSGAEQRRDRLYHVMHWKLDGQEHSSAPFKAIHTPSGRAPITGYVLKRPDGESYLIGFKAY